MVLPVALGAAFIGLALVAHRAMNGTMLDHAVLEWLLAHRRDGLTTAAVVVTTVGSPLAMTVLALIACAALWWRHSVATGLIVAATLGTAYGMSTTTKVLVGAHRPPPSVQLLLEHDPSYPSGHVTGTVALLGILAVVIGVGRRAAIRRALAAGVAIAALAVAVTRLYLGVHWLTDVAGGVLLGGIAVALGSVVNQKVRQASGSEVISGSSTGRRGPAARHRQ